MSSFFSGMIDINWLLVAAAFGSGAVSAIVGMVGGTLLLVMMMVALPVNLVIPVHGIVQFSSNFSRVLIHRKRILWNRMGVFAFGVLGGAVIGYPFISQLRLDGWDAAIGVAVLFMTWIPLKKSKSSSGSQTNQFSPWVYGSVGAVGSFLSLFVGAIGIILGAFFLRERLPKESHLGTQAFCQVLIHLAKVLVYFGSGFAIGAYFWLIAWMVAATFFGNWIGTKIMKWIPDRIFYRVIQGVVTLLAFQLIIR